MIIFQQVVQGLQEALVAATEATNERRLACSGWEQESDEEELGPAWEEEPYVQSERASTSRVALREDAL